MEIISSLGLRLSLSSSSGLSGSGSYTSQPQSRVIESVTDPSEFVAVAVV